MMHRPILPSARRALALSLFLLAVAALPAAAQEGRAFEPEDWYRLTTLSNPAMSPDGRWVAFVATTIDVEDNARHREVWMVSTEGGDPMRMTAPGTESSNPRFTADGAYLLFTSSREGGDGSTWAIPMDGRPGEAIQIEDQLSGSMPADRSFSVTTGGPEDDDEAEEEEEEAEPDPFRRMASTARPPWGSVTEPVDPARFDGRHIVDLGYKRNGAGFVANRREAREWSASQIWIEDADDPESRRMITDTPYSHSNATVSPDGRWIAFVADAEFRTDSAVAAEAEARALLPYDAARDEAPRNDRDVFLIPVDGGDPVRLTNQNGNEGGLMWSPDSRSLAFTSSLEQTSSERLWIIDDVAAGSSPRNVLGDWTYEPAMVEWMPNGTIAMSAAVGGRTALFHVNPVSGDIREVISGRRRINGFSFDEDYRRVAFVATSVDQPTELFLANVDGTNERRLTGLNDELNAEIDWPAAERFTYESVGGLEIEAWLQYPAGYEEGRRYPLVLYIHGGPHSAYGEGWFDEFHNLTGAGMFVLYTNPRGSAGYGADFTYSTRGRWGLEDYEDLMRAVDIAIERPDVDPERLGVTGGSYGGFMTAWITTRTDRFKAAQTDRMISNWFSWWGTSDVPGLTDFEFYGHPWENQELYWDLSPLKFVDNVTTPTLIVQSEEDHRTPMADAEQWFQSLRVKGVPVEFVRYPRSTHDLSRTGEPWLLVDRLGRLRQWFEYWLTGPGFETDGAPDAPTPDDIH